MKEQWIDLRNNLIDWSSRRPNEIAVITPKSSTTYFDFATDIKLTFNWLKRVLNQETERLGIIIEDEYWNWVTHLAAWEVGLEILSLRSPDNASVVKFLNIDEVICCSCHTKKYTKAQAHTFSPTGIKELAAKVKPTRISLRSPNAKNVKEELREAPYHHTQSSSRLVLTSGTTGYTRCVLWDSTITMSRIGVLRRSLRMDETTKVYSFQHIGTTGGFRYPLACWQAGGAVILRGDSKSLDASISAMQNANLIVIAPINLGKIVNENHQQWDDRQKRHIVLAGGRVTKSQMMLAQSLCANTISIAYGSTESGAIATGPASLISRHRGAAGFVRENVEVQIVDQQDMILPPGKQGRVRVKSPYMVCKYEVLTANKVDRTDEFKDGWFYPGDLGVLSADGFLAILGRESEIANFGGYKISLVDIEAELMKVSGINDITAIKLELEDNEKLGIVVVAQDKKLARLILDRTKKIVKQQTPVVLIFTSSIERNEMGKVPKSILATKITKTIKKKLT